MCQLCGDATVGSSVRGFGDLLWNRIPPPPPPLRRTFLQLADDAFAACAATFTTPALTERERKCVTTVTHKYLAAAARVSTRFGEAQVEASKGTAAHTSAEEARAVLTAGASAAAGGEGAAADPVAPQNNAFTAAMAVASGGGGSAVVYGAAAPAGAGVVDAPSGRDGGDFGALSSRPSFPVSVPAGGSGGGLR